MTKQTDIMLLAEQMASSMNSFDDTASKLI